MFSFPRTVLSLKQSTEPTQVQHKAASEDRAGYPERSYLPGCRQPEHPQERSAQGVARGVSPDRARLHPQGCSVAEPDRGMVAAIPAAGAGRDRFRRQRRDSPCDEGRHPAAESQSQTVGVGTTSKTAEESDAHFCVPSLRIGALVYGQAKWGYVPRLAELWPAEGTRIVQGADAGASERTAWEVNLQPNSLQIHHALI